MYKQVQPQKNYEIVMHQIRERITKGELVAGQKLDSVVNLATQFGVGRSTIREALSALKAMGWVQIRQGGGTFVSVELPNEASNSHSEQIKSRFLPLFDGAETIKEILEVRKIIETGCAALAAENRTEQHLFDLRGILQFMKEHLEDEAVSEQADVHFHLKIAEATQNPTLVNLMQSLSQNMQKTMRSSRQLWFYAQRASAERLYQEHLQIYEAIQQGQSTLASDRMLAHLYKVEQTLLKMSSTSMN